ncbi:MAG: hypothetical protein QOH21_1010 [Acidobacteriota bacterium]|jgi:hypothetical protein|nr:hypothetical protein [Acidobacteriota bacterium]
MNNACSRTLLMALAVVAFLSVLPDDAYATAPSTMETEPTPAARAELWREAIEDFTAAHPDLTPEQAQLLDQGVSLGDEIATLTQDTRAQAAFAREATAFMEHARELFTNSQLGELFTAMGETQVWMAQVTAGDAYCTCTGTNTCTIGPGGPSGSCQAGCTSWAGSDGLRRDGLCGPAASTE